MQNINIGKLNKLDYSAEAAYKSLVSKLLFSGKDIKTVVVTSANEGEGKTTVAINLSRSLAEAGKNVLFIDADMRNSVLISRYKITKSTNGLSHFLSGQKELDDTMCSTNIEGLYVMTAGMQPAGPDVLLRSAVFENFIKAARDKFDYVIIDTPAETVYKDADIVSGVCDGSCLVAAPGTISVKTMTDIRDRYEEADCELLGVILNKVKTPKQKVR